MSEPQRPTFTVVTATYNCSERLRRTVESLSKQNPSLFEHVLVDGVSTDGTVAVIEEHAVMAPYPVRFVSEKDRGIYDAMNKGIDLAAGRFLLFLNAGDLLVEGVLEEFAPQLPAGTLAMVYGNALMEGGHVYGAPFDKSKLAKLNICHQAIFYGREVFATVGKYDLQYRVYADHVLNMQCFADARIEKHYIDKIVSEYEADGFSATTKDLNFERDRRALIGRYLGKRALVAYSVFRMEYFGPRPLRVLIHGTKDIVKILLRRPRGQRTLDNG